MTVYLSRSGASLILLARAVAPDLIGDAVIELHPGEFAFGRSYESWRSLPDGPHEVK